MAVNVDDKVETLIEEGPVSILSPANTKGSAPSPAKSSTFGNENSPLAGAYKLRQKSSRTETSIRPLENSARDEGQQVPAGKRKQHSMSSAEITEKRHLLTSSSTNKFSISTYKHSNSFQAKSSPKRTLNDSPLRARNVSTSLSPRNHAEPSEDVEKPRDYGALENHRKSDIKAKLKTLTATNFDLKPRVTNKSPFMVVKKSFKILPSVSS